MMPQSQDRAGVKKAALSVNRQGQEIELNNETVQVLKTELVKLWDEHSIPRHHRYKLYALIL